MTAKFDGRLPDEQVNLPTSHPLKDAVTLLWVALALGAAYFVLGWAAEKAVVNMSYETERKLLKPFESALTEMERRAHQVRNFRELINCFSG